MSTEHKDSAPEGCDSLVTVVVQQPGGASHRLSGLVGGGRPLLVDIGGATFSQGAALVGDVILYRGQANNQVLPAVAGKYNSFFFVLVFKSEKYYEMLIQFTVGQLSLSWGAILEFGELISKFSKTINSIESMI